MRWKLYSALIILLLLVGCGFPKNPRTGTSDYDYQQGSVGLEVRLVANNPPSNLYDVGDNDALPILVEVRNRGTTPLDISEFWGHIFLTGFDDDIFPETATWKAIGELNSRGPYDYEGGYKVIDMTCDEAQCLQGSDYIELPSGTDSYKPKLQLNTCYRYKTSASPAVCVDPTPYAGVENVPKACNVQDVSMGGGQGAPVAVSMVEVNIMPRKAQFKVHVSNVGGGTVVTRDAISSTTPNNQDYRCPYNLGYQDLNRIEYDIDYGGSILSNFQCEPQSGEFRLPDSQSGIIFCTADISSQGNAVGAVLTPLNIRLDYGYMQTQTFQLNVQNLNPSAQQS